MPTLDQQLHPCRAMPAVSITAEEAALLVALLRPRASLLTELLELQTQHCPRGCSDWADTADALAVVNSAMHKLHNAQLEIGSRG
jgi:hypothetical protein